MINKAILKFENSKNMVIKVTGNSKENIYVQNIRLNGKVTDKNFIRHGDLINGGKLVFRMGHDPEIREEQKPGLIHIQ